MKERRKRGLFSLPRSPFCSLFLFLLSSVLLFPAVEGGEAAEVDRWLGERGMDFMPRARYMAAATPGQK